MAERAIGLALRALQKARLCYPQLFYHHVVAARNGERFALLIEYFIHRLVHCLQRAHTLRFDFLLQRQHRKPEQRGKQERG